MPDDHPFIGCLRRGVENQQVFTTGRTGKRLQGLVNHEAARSDRCAKRAGDPVVDICRGNEWGRSNRCAGVNGCHGTYRPFARALWTVPCVERSVIIEKDSAKR